MDHVELAGVLGEVMEHLATGESVLLIDGPLGDQLWHQVPDSDAFGTWDPQLCSNENFVGAVADEFTKYFEAQEKDAGRIESLEGDLEQALALDPLTWCSNPAQELELEALLNEFRRRHGIR